MFLLHWVVFFSPYSRIFHLDNEGSQRCAWRKPGSAQGKPLTRPSKVPKNDDDGGFLSNTTLFLLTTMPYSISENSIDYGVKPGCHQVCDKL